MRLCRHLLHIRGGRIGEQDARFARPTNVLLGYTPRFPRDANRLLRLQRQRLPGAGKTIWRGRQFERQEGKLGGGKDQSKMRDLVEIDTVRTTNLTIEVSS